MMLCSEVSEMDSSLNYKSSIRPSSVNSWKEGDFFFKTSSIWKNNIEDAGRNVNFYFFFFIKKSVISISYETGVSS